MNTNEARQRLQETHEVIRQALPHENVVAKYQPQTAHLARPVSPNIEGLEGLDMNRDITLGRWRLVQPSSIIEGEPGQWNNNLTGELRSELRLIVLKVSPCRAMFSEERRLLCSSRDSYVSLGGKFCQACPESQWGEDGEPSPCGFGYTYVCWDPEDEALCLTGAMSTAVTAAKKYNGLLVHRRKSPFTFTTIFSSHPETGAKGKWAALDITLGDPLDPARIEEMRSMYYMLTGLQYKEVEEPTPFNDLEEPSDMEYQDTSPPAFWPGEGEGRD